ncbi:hypothetical protein [Fluviicola taffensis]|uniref:Uncharacterized protein n=1 Tax=Fluviicola taffensis (strain DSM 16823 / NCIMB 13979 / RW262) TaxID=755732 RepID=F2IG37_FLUTR|nr:hypothetical protein [Fluviicola taffensis]AEA44672.1 hypothetical protein Fluta_2691 [Fluviicola taffensis DSM 16823]
MNLLLKGILSLILLQFCFLSYGQTITQELTPEQIASRVGYVHGSQFVQNYPDLVTVYGKVMTERIEYQMIAQDQYEKYPLLSSFPLMAKVNPSIQGANFENFNVASFNPMAYNIDFFSDKTQVIRIDNTNYIMVIRPNKFN